MLPVVHARPLRPLAAPFPIELRHVIVIQAAMPCALIPVLLAKHYGGEPALALRIILVTSLLGLLTIPLWIQLGLRWLGTGPDDPSPLTRRKRARGFSSPRASDLRGAPPARFPPGG